MYDQNKELVQGGNQLGYTPVEQSQINAMNQPQLNNQGAYFAGQAATAAYTQAGNMQPSGNNQQMGNMLNSGMPNQFTGMAPNMMPGANLNQAQTDVMEVMTGANTFEGGNLRTAGEMIMSGEMVNENGENVLDSMGHEETLATRGGVTEKKIKSELRDGDNISNETAKEVHAVIAQNKHDPFELNEKIFQMGVEYRRELYGRVFGENN